MNEERTDLSARFKSQPSGKSISTGVRAYEVRGPKPMYPYCSCGNAGAGYDASYFQNYFVNNPSETPDGPDADDDRD